MGYEQGGMNTADIIQLDNWLLSAEKVSLLKLWKILSLKSETTMAKINNRERERGFCEDISEIVFQALKNNTIYKALFIKHRLD